MYIIKSYLSAFAIFLIIDLIWLGFIAKDLYAKYLGFIMAKNINWTAAIIFYMIFVGGILFFVVNPAIEKNSLSYALLAGAAFGFITYATYDLTNLATLRQWPMAVVATVASLASRRRPRAMKLRRLMKVQRPTHFWRNPSGRQSKPDGTPASFSFGFPSGSRSY